MMTFREYVTFFIDKQKVKEVNKNKQFQGLKDLKYHYF